MVCTWMKINLYLSSRFLLSFFTIPPSNSYLYSENLIRKQISYFRHFYLFSKYNSTHNLMQFDYLLYTVKCGSHYYNISFPFFYNRGVYFVK